MAAVMPCGPHRLKRGKSVKEKLKTCLDLLRSKGVDYADCRYVRTNSESIQVADARVESLSRETDKGVGIRVLADGCWGFAATSNLTVRQLERTARRALEIARASAVVRKEPVKLAEQEPFVDTYATPFVTNPFDVPFGTKLDLLVRTCDALHRDDRIRTAHAWMIFTETKKLFMSTEGAQIEQDLLESGGGFDAIAWDGKQVQRRSNSGSTRGKYAARGYEQIEDIDMVGDADRVREEAVALLTARPCPAGNFDTIISGSAMALQLHESCGHPSELDRVLGTEISLAGGSFLTTDKLGSFRYGADIVNITADATIPGALGTFGYDDEGVKARRVPLVRDGIWSGYLTSRETAPTINRRSGGAMRASGWNRLPLIRMTNINLEPGQWELDDLITDTRKGVLLGDIAQVSIDDLRLNFQFSVECAWEIKNGKLGQIYRNPLYTGLTPRFWNNCTGICNKNHWHMWGVVNCGKGEPMQVMHLGHGTAPARFRNLELGSQS